MKQVALLRGINVGKSVQVPMKALKGLLEDLGFTAVVTYLNSGNVVFWSDHSPEEASSRFEAALAQRYGQAISVLVKTADEILGVEAAIPAEWKSDDTEQTYVAYLFPDVDRPDLVDELPVNRQFATLLYTPGAFVWNIKRENYNRSQITKIAAHPAYRRMTTRNVNTARKLADLCRGG
jgi:uncharacterized protein (DUF1697 family)